MRTIVNGTDDPGSDPSRSEDVASGAVTFIFHTGFHKTGSTALQAYLAHNAARLKQAGVAYACAVGKGGGPGNGQQLCEMIRKGKITANKIDELLNVHLDNCSTAIISSEDFSHFGLAEWQKIAEATARLRGRVRTVTFIRDLAPYYSSLHAQLLSGGETTIAFKEFAERSDIFVPVLASLKCLLQTFQREAMTLLHYESVMNGIDKAFLGTLGLSCGAFDDAPLHQRVNRSLTEFEQDIVLRVTKATGGQLVRGLSGQLKARRPHLKAKRYFSGKLIGQLSARHAADVDWINSVFFGGEPVLQISRGVPDGQPKVGISDAECKAIYRDVIDWCLEKIKVSQDESFRYMGRRLHDIDWNFATNPLVPAEFDPIAYLAQNPDVLRKGSAPFKHYIDYGHKEPNRRWKWTT